MIDANALNGVITDEDYEKVLNAPCIHADLPNGMDGGMYLATPTHEGMTNGDMIKAMFPNVQVIREEHRFMNFLKVSENWWNEPYKGSEG